MNKSDKSDQPTGSKQGCYRCGEIEYHTQSCDFNKNLSAFPAHISREGKGFYLPRKPVLPSERSAGDDKLSIGTRIRFPREVDSPANEEHPHLVYAYAGESGEIVSYNEFEGYNVKTDRHPHTFGATREEFEVSAGDERKCLDHCEHDLSETKDGACLAMVMYRYPPFSIGNCRHRCTFAPREAERHEFIARTDIHTVNPVCAFVTGENTCCGLPREAEVHGALVVDYERDRQTGEVFTVQKIVPTTRTREEVAQEIMETLRDVPYCRPCDSYMCPEHWQPFATNTISTALTTATDEVWERAIAAFNDEIARQAEFGMYPSEEDFRLAFEAARKANP